MYPSLDSHAEPDPASVTSLCRDRAKTTALAHVPRAARDSLAEEYEIIYPWLRPKKDAPPPPYPLPTLPVEELPLMALPLSGGVATFPGHVAEGG